MPDEPENVDAGAPEENGDAGEKAYARTLLESAKQKKIMVIADKLIEKYHIITVPGKRADTIYRYHEGVYVPDGKTVCETEAEAELLRSAKTHSIGEVLGHVKRRTYGNPAAPPEKLIPLQNGVYDLATETLQPHSPENFFKFQHPIIYDAAATCPKIDAFFEKVLNPDDIPLLLEWFGYQLYRSHGIKKCAIFLGATDTSKTQMTLLEKSFVGEANVQSLSMQNLTSNRFSTSQLRDKCSNIYDDLSAETVNDIGRFKILTGGGITPFEEKFADSGSFYNYCKQTFACNEIPGIKEGRSIDWAFYSRLMLVPFANVIPKGERVFDFYRQLTAPAELSGLLNRCLEALKGLLERGDFLYGLSPQENRDIMLRSNSPLAAFVDEMLVPAPGAFVPKDLFMSVFVHWAKLRGRQPITKSMMTRQLPLVASYVAVGRRLVDGVRVEAYLNLRLGKLSDSGAVSGTYEEPDFPYFFLNHEKYEKEGNSVLNSYKVFEKNPGNPVRLARSGGQP